MENRSEVSTHHHHGHAHHGHEPHPPQGHLEPRRPSPDELKHIQGWGADLDRKNRPAVPMEHTPPRFIGAPVPEPAQQAENVEVLVSPERPGITPVFGTAEPPSGLSGMIRRAAYKMTENDIRHWLLLLLADRVNVVEGIGEDLARGHIPNILGEMGLKSELKHNPAGLVKKVAIAGAVVGAAYVLLNRRNRYR